MGRKLKDALRGKRKARRCAWFLCYTLSVTILLHILRKVKISELRCSASKFAWIETGGCYAFSHPVKNLPSMKTSCDIIGPASQSGFCLCQETIIAAPFGCVHSPINCEMQCLQSNTIKGSPRQLCTKQLKSRKEPYLNFSSRKGVHPYYRLLSQVLGTKIRDRIPGTRRIEIDYLVLNKRIERESVRYIRNHLNQFLKETYRIPYNSKYFPIQRGIVIVGGSGKKYRTAYWVCIHSIRRAGSKLPIELWFLEKELPSMDELRVLEQELFVKVRSFDEIWGGISSKNEPRGYELKIYATVYSYFNEVLFLDADNVAVSLVDALFSEVSYEQHGSLFWQDYWYSSADPSCSDIFGRSSMVKETHESGQMLINKGKIWRALLSALYMTYNSETFYPLTCGFLGYGDKEILPFALRKLNFSYGLIEHGPDHVGVFRRNGNSNTSDIYGNTMLQFNSLGEPVFLHANLGKWTTHVPEKPINYVRRWQASILYGANLVNILEEIAGVDLEMWIYRLISDNACLFDNRNPKYWYEKIGIGPLVEGVNLHLYPQKNLDLEIFASYRSV